MLTDEKLLALQLDYKVSKKVEEWKKEYDKEEVYILRRLYRIDMYLMHNISSINMVSTDLSSWLLDSNVVARMKEEYSKIKNEDEFFMTEIKDLSTAPTNLEVGYIYNIGTKVSDFLNMMIGNKKYPYKVKELAAITHLYEVKLYDNFLIEDKYRKLTFSSNCIGEDEFKFAEKELPKILSNKSCVKVK